MSVRRSTLRRRIATLLPLSVFAVTASFALGMQTAGDLQTISGSFATDAPRGDMNADGTVDAADAIIVLEIAQGYRTATPQELAADPNGNGILAVDDAIRILRSVLKH